MKGIFKSILLFLSMLLSLVTIAQTGFSQTSPKTNQQDSFTVKYFDPANNLLLIDIKACDSLAHIALHNSKSNYDSTNVFRLIGRIWLYKGSYKIARDTLNHSLNYLTHINDTTELLLTLNILNSLGETFKEEDKYDSARVYYQKIYDVLKGQTSSKGKLLKAKVCNNLGEIDLFQNKNADAFLFLNQSILMLDTCMLESKGNDFNKEVSRVRGYVLESFGMYYEQNKHLDSAYFFYKKSYNLRDSLRNSVKEKNTYEFILINFRLWKFYQLNDNFPSDSIPYFENLLTCSQNYSTETIFRFTHDLVKSIKAESKAKENEGIVKRKYLIAFVFAVVLFCVTIVFFFNSRNLSRKKHKLNKELNESNSQLTSTINELNSQKKDLEKLNEIGQVISESISITDTDITILVRNIYTELNKNKLVDAPMMIIGLYNSITRSLDYYGVENGHHQKYESKETKIEKKSALVQCYETGKAKIIPRYKDEGYDHAKKDEGLTPNSVAVNPLKIKEEIIGVFSVQSMDDNAYDGKELILENLAAKISSAINNFISYEELYTKSLEVSTILSIISHDSSNEINQCLDELTLISNSNKNPKKFQSIMDAIAQLKELLQIPKTVFEGAEPRMPLEMVKIESLPFFDNMLSKYEKQCKIEGIRFDSKFSNMKIFVSDKNVIRFVIQNFLSNAIKSIKEVGRVRRHFKGRIEITVELIEKENVLRIEVSDNGIGLEQQNVDKYFNNKERINEFKMGHGFAMKMSRYLVDDYNIRLFSDQLANQKLSKSLFVTNNSDEEEIEGCTFHLYLPVVIQQKNEKD